MQVITVQDLLPAYKKTIRDLNLPYKLIIILGENLNSSNMTYWVGNKYIDRPEGVLHPKLQITYAESLAQIINGDSQQRILTTHSPYIIDHLNNLMAIHGLPNDQQHKIVEKLYYKKYESILNPNDVECYLYADNKLTSCFNREANWIDTHTFAQQSNYLSELYGDILEVAREAKPQIKMEDLNWSKDV